MNILAIIPCLNEEKTIAPVVLGLLAQAQTLPMQIVIVDGGSGDNTLPILHGLVQKYPQLTLLHNEKRLQGAAINLAVAAYGEGKEYLIRIDAHAHYPQNYCATLVAEAHAADAENIVVTMRAEGKTPFQRMAAAAQNSRLGNGGAAHRRDVHAGSYVAHGHHALMRMDAFKDVGGYDEHFSHNEDAELDHRFAQKHYRTWLTAKTAITYYPRGDAASLFRQYRNYGRGCARTIAKHHVAPKLRQLLPAMILPAVALALLSPINVVMALPLLLWAGMCLSYGYLLGAHANDKELMWAGIPAMIMHAGWSLGFWEGVIIELRRRQHG